MRLKSDSAVGWCNSEVPARMGFAPPARTALAFVDGLSWHAAAFSPSA